MERINNIEDIEILKNAHPGEAYLVKPELIHCLWKKGLLVNEKNNRNADESKWGKTEIQNYFNRLQNEFDNFEKYGTSPNYITLMAPITIKVEAGAAVPFEISDGMHRVDCITKLYDYDIPSKFMDRENIDSFCNRIIESCKNNEFDDEVQNVLNNLYFLVRITNDYVGHYTGENSSKVMKKQQKFRVEYKNNELLKTIQALVEDKLAKCKFVPSASKSSAIETAASDLTSLLSFFAGDYKPNKMNNASYTYNKYGIISEDVDRFKEIFEEFLNILESLVASNNLDFVFTGNSNNYRNVAMYGLLDSVRILSLELCSNYYKAADSTILKKVKNEKDSFFAFLSLNLYVLKHFSIKGMDELHMKELTEAISNTKDGTGQFARGALISQRLSLTRVNTADEFLKLKKKDKKQLDSLIAAVKVA